MAIIQLTEGLMPDVKVIAPGRARPRSGSRDSRGVRLLRRVQARRAAVTLAAPRSDSPDEYQRAVVGAARARLQGPDKLGRPGAEPGGNQPVRLAEQPVNPDVDVPAGNLDQPVGVEHQRIAWPQRALLGHAPQVGND